MKFLVQNLLGRHLQQQVQGNVIPSNYSTFCDQPPTHAVTNAIILLLSLPLTPINVFVWKQDSSFVTSADGLSIRSAPRGIHSFDRPRIVVIYFMIVVVLLFYIFCTMTCVVLSVQVHVATFLSITCAAEKLTMLAYSHSL